MIESIPPLTVEHVERDLQNPTLSVYLYIGSQTDPGWENAEMIFGLLSRLRIYLVTDPAAVQKWWDTEQPAGIVFGWGQAVHRLLNRAERYNRKLWMRS